MDETTGGEDRLAAARPCQVGGNDRQVARRLSAPSRTSTGQIGKENCEPAWLEPETDVQLHSLKTTHHNGKFGKVVSGADDQTGRCVVEVCMSVSKQHSVCCSRRGSMCCQLQADASPTISDPCLSLSHFQHHPQLKMHGKESQNLT